jgi:hypothetical protein
MPKLWREFDGTLNCQLPIDARIYIRGISICPSKE